MTTPARLRDVGSTYGGLTGKTKADFGHGDASFVTFLEVINNTRLRSRALARVRVSKGERQNQVMRGDLLFNGSSETPEDVALAAVVDFDPEAPTFLNSFCFGFRPRSGGAVDPTYLAYFFRSTAGRSLVASLAQGATRYNIAKTKFLDLKLVLPSVERQRQIVEALEDIDDSVMTLERMVAKKLAIKQGVMQQFLTGRTRLSGFSGEWVEVTLADLLKFKNGLNKGSEYFGAGTPIVNFMDVMSGPIVRGKDLRGKVTLSRDEIKRFSAHKGDLFFTRTSESVEEVGTTAVVVDDVPDAVFSGFVLRGRPRGDDVNGRFTAYRMQLADARAQITSVATYTTRALTNGKALGRVSFRIPPPEEQAAIAGVVADLEEELEVLGRRLAKAREIKQGMAHGLLSGHGPVTAGDES